MTRWGTCHWVTLDDAIHYYRNQGCSPDQVLWKLAAGEIKIGKPTELKPGDRLVVIPGEGRYAIEED